MAEIIVDTNGVLSVSAEPIVPFIEGDGIGLDIMPVTRQVVDASVEKAYGGRRRIRWLEVFAGEKAFHRFGVHLPEETLKRIREHRVAIKGPLATPVGGGVRSLNVALRQKLDLFACVRPVRHIPGVPAPVCHPEKLDIVIFRENTEDVYAGIEFASGSPDAERIALFLGELGHPVFPGSAIGVKPMSRERSSRLVEAALRYAIAHRRSTVTLMHKGNIMKYTEGGFRQWGYDAARTSFPDRVITEEEMTAGRPRGDRILVNDRIADAMFQELLLRPESLDVIAAPNLNGDYLSDAAAAQVGGLGMAPGANMSGDIALFEATHGTAPALAGKNLANPGSLLLSAAMMLDHLGWSEAAENIRQALGRAIAARKVTRDLADQMEGVTPLSTADFSAAVIANWNPSRDDPSLKTLPLRSSWFFPSHNRQTDDTSEFME